MLSKRNEFKDYQTINLNIPKNIDFNYIKELIFKKFEELDRIPIILKIDKKRFIGIAFNFRIKNEIVEIDYCVDLEFRNLKKIGMFVKKNQRKIKRIICFYME